MDEGSAWRFGGGCLVLWKIRAIGYKIEEDGEWQDAERAGCSSGESSLQ